MGPETVLDVGRDALWMSVLLAGPLLGAALAVGLLIGIFQAATQIRNDPELYSQAAGIGDCAICRRALDDSSIGDLQSAAYHQHPRTDRVRWVLRCR